MTTIELIAELSRPEAVPFAVEAVEVRQTHISVVVLAGGFVYKVRKPVRLSFLDFSTFTLRKLDCEAEVRLNRRLAPHVYLGVVPLARTATGLQFEATGEAVEWAVKMVRLPEDATLLARLRWGVLTETEIGDLARVVADFHTHAAAGAAVAAFGRLDVVARNARENFDESAAEVGVTVSHAVFERLRTLTETALRKFGPLIGQRAERGIPRDTHGDLHLDHVYHFPDQSPTENWIIIDCIEFNERFRFADPVSDLAFLVMDLTFRGRRDLAAALAEAYFSATGDVEGRTLLPFYIAYRAAVRAKVEGLVLREAEVPDEEKNASRQAAQGHWLLALGELEEPEQRPALVLIGGLPGTGKSTLTRALATENFRVIRSDDVRRELFTAGDDKYSSANLMAVYEECRQLAEQELFAGQCVIVDASFREEAMRTPFRELAEGLTVPLYFVICEAVPEIVRQRLAARHGDTSEADWNVYQWAAARWEAPSFSHLVVAMDGGVAAAKETVLNRLRTGQCWSR